MRERNFESLEKSVYIVISLYITIRPSNRVGKCFTMSHVITSETAIQMYDIYIVLVFYFIVCPLIRAAYI